MSRQGFAESSAGDIYVYQEMTSPNISAALGLSISAGTLNFNVINGPGALPDLTSEIIIDPTTKVVTISNLAISGTIVIPGFGAGVVQTDSGGAVFTNNGTNGQILIGGGSAPAWMNITAGTGISITNGANSITIDSSGSSSSWVEVVLAAATMAPDTGYVANNAGLVTLMLPVTAPFGSVFRVTGKGVGGWKIAQQVGQTIYFGVVTTTTGVGGYLQSTQQRDSIEIVCITADTEFNVLSIQGNVTFN